MFVVLTYDVHRSRVGRMSKLCKRYLRHVQRSVFDGELTEAKLAKLRKDIAELVDTSYDSVQIYIFDSVRFAHKECIGQTTVVDGLL